MRVLELGRRLRLPGGLRPWVAGGSLLFVLWALVSHGRQVLDLAPDQRGWSLLLIGLSLTVVAQWLNGIAWWGLLRWLSLPLPWQEAVPLYVRTNLLKYLPGGVWHLVGRMGLLRQRGCSGRQALGAVLLEPLLMAIAALCLVPLGGFQAGLGLVSPFGLLLLRPAWLNPLLERLLRQKQSLVSPGEEPGGANGSQLRLQGPPWQPLLWEFPFLGLRFAGFASCVLCFSEPVGPGWGVWLAAFALAWTAGLVVPGAPGGLGVFELVLLTRLRGQVPEPELLAVLVSYRLISVLAELLAAAGAAADSRNKP